MGRGANRVGSGRSVAGEGERAEFERFPPRGGARTDTGAGWKARTDGHGLESPCYGAAGTPRPTPADAVRGAGAGAVRANFAVARGGSGEFGLQPNPIFTIKTLGRCPRLR